jgi:hypothetical protein
MTATVQDDNEELLGDRKERGKGGRDRSIDTLTSFQPSGFPGFSMGRR